MPDAPPTQAASPEQLQKIGERAAQLIQPHHRVGLGSGKAALAFVRALGQRIRSENLQISAVATSLLTEKVAHESGVPLQTLAQIPALDIAVDGADEVDPHLNLIKGGGGNLTREKVIASIAQRFVIVVGEEKLVVHLGERFPVFVEVIEFAQPAVTRKLQSMGAKVEPRRNPDGSPFLTDNHNPYLHCDFTHAPKNPLADPRALDRALHQIPGIVETGLFINMATEVLIAHTDNTIEHRPSRNLGTAIDEG